MYPLIYYVQVYSKIYEFGEIKTTISLGRWEYNLKHTLKQ